MTAALEGGEASQSRPGRSLPPGKTRYAMYRRLGGPQGRSGQVRKISPPTGIRSPDRPARSSVSIPTELPGPPTVCPYLILRSRYDGPLSYKVHFVQPMHNSMKFLVSSFVYIHFLSHIFYTSSQFHFTVFHILIKLMRGTKQDTRHLTLSILTYLTVSYSVKLHLPNIFL